MVCRLVSQPQEVQSHDYPGRREVIYSLSQYNPAQEATQCFQNFNQQ